PVERASAATTVATTAAMCHHVARRPVTASSCGPVRRRARGRQRSSPPLPAGSAQPVDRTHRACHGRTTGVPGGAEASRLLSNDRQLQPAVAPSVLPTGRGEVDDRIYPLGSDKPV